MMKSEKNIGLVTYYKENYGSILQCYATKAFLESMGFRCHILYQEYDLMQYFELRLKNLVYHAYKSIRYKGYFSKYVLMRKSMHREKGFLTEIALEKQNNFVKDVLEPEGFTWKKLCKMARNEEYVAFIAGSDQIWNASIRIDPIYFLKFVPNEKRIALAPSFGISEIPTYNQKDVLRGLKGFNRIAVREKIGENIIANFCNVPTIRVADPVFLLSGEQWKLFAKNAEVPRESYIFVHFLNPPKEKTVNEIEKLSISLGSQIICFSYDYQEYSLFKKVIHINGDPKEYVALIQNAKCVCTDSFHSTAFSILLHTVFYTFPRQHLHKESQECRVTNLLEEYGLQRMYCEDGNLHSESAVNWATIDEVSISKHTILVKYLEEELEKRS